jgi:hypothetical protein
MFGLFGRSRRAKPQGRPRPVRLRVEELEPRFCPAGGSIPAPAPFAIASFNATVLNIGHQVELSGSVSGASDPASCYVSFGGVCETSASVNAQAQFDIITTATSLGNVTAIGVDNLGDQTQPVTDTLVVAPPMLTLNLSYGTQKTVTASGVVVAGQANGLAVSISGQLSGGPTTDANGDYTVTATAAGLGNVYAQVTDVWGQTSEVEQATITSKAPQITSFSASPGFGNVWVFSGTVVDESAQGLIVALGGLPSLNGKTATVASNGNFSLSVQLQPGEDGVATAQTADWWGLQSNVAQVLVTP